MTTKKFLLLLIVPILVIGTVGLIAMWDIRGAETPRADALGGLIGIVYGVYSVALTKSWLRARRERS